MLELHSNQQAITIETVGVFRVFAPDGQELTPAGTRPRAVLAAIALSPNKTASRRWLEALLWPDREQEQASTSLRQTLSILRRKLADYKHLLNANRTDIWLDPAQVLVDMLDFSNVAIERGLRGRDLLEGLDIPSEPFEDWLRLERSRLHHVVDSAEPIKFASPAKAEGAGSHVPPSQSPVLLAETQAGPGKFEDFFAESIRAQLGHTAAELMQTDVIIVDDSTVQAIRAPGCRCLIKVIEAGNEVRVLARLTQVPTGKLIWSRTVSFDPLDGQAAMDTSAALSFEASEAIAACMSDASEPALANALAASALQHVFSFDPFRLEQADRLLEQANALFPHAPRPALRALAKAFLALEKSEGALDNLKGDAQNLLTHALEINPGNALALAFAADVHDLVFDDPGAALATTERALALNAGTGYAYASLGALELRRNRPQEALAASIRARGQLENTSLQVFALMRHCVAAMSAGQFSEATKSAEKAAILAPESRPPLRHLYALRLNSGDQKGAQDALRSLRRLEPEFSLARLREDPSLPAATIRKTGLVSLTDIEI